MGQPLMDRRFSPNSRAVPLAIMPGVQLPESQWALPLKQSTWRATVTLREALKAGDLPKFAATLPTHPYAQRVVEVASFNDIL